MNRKRRSFNDAGHAHELTFSCYHRFKFLRAERTCFWLVEAIEAMRIRLDVALWGYVFMPEHVHLIIRPRRVEYEMSTILRAIKYPVARRAVAYLARHAPAWLPRITEHGEADPERHFWQPGGGYDRNIVEPTTLAVMLEYVHFNPVRRGLVSRPSDWRWSSAARYEDSPRRVVPIIPDPIPPEWLDGVR